jgi:hypothetical protein
METKEPWFMKTGQDSWVIVAGRVKTLPSPNYYPTFIGDSVGGGEARLWSWLYTDHPPSTNSSLKSPHNPPQTRFLSSLHLT